MPLKCHALSKVPSGDMLASVISALEVAKNVSQAVVPIPLFSVIANAILGLLETLEVTAMFCSSELCSLVAVQKMRSSKELCAQLATRASRLLEHIKTRIEAELDPISSAAMNGNLSQLIRLASSSLSALFET